jgi:hypothetical protein
MRRLDTPEPCGYCRRPAWGADEVGPAHGCCIAWRHAIQADRLCPACQAAEIVLRQPTHNPDGTAQQVRLPAMYPLPRTLPDGTPYVPDFGSRTRAGDAQLAAQVEQEGPEVEAEAEP